MRRWTQPDKHVLATPQDALDVVNALIEVQNRLDFGADRTHLRLRYAVHSLINNRFHLQVHLLQHKLLLHQQRLEATLKEQREELLGEGDGSNALSVGDHRGDVVRRHGDLQSAEEVLRVRNRDDFGRTNRCRSTRRPGPRRSRGSTSESRFR